MNCLSQTKIKEIIYVLLDKYAAHEMVFLSQAINDGEMGPRECPKYINKVVAHSMEPVTSIGGTRTLPDYTFDTVPHDYAALVLIGGHGWRDDLLADEVLPLVKDAIAKGRIVGAICNAASWMAKHGFLNNIRHTGNGIQQLKLWAGENYTNEANYVNEQAVHDRNIITANGSGYLEFAKELLLFLENDTQDMTERYYQFNKQGLVKLFSPHPQFSFNTIGLFTTDNQKMVDFYCDIFGFETEWNGIDIDVELHLDSMRILLFPRDSIERMTSQKFTYPSGINGTMEISFDVPTFADVDKEYNRALSMGAKPIMEPTTEPWGQRTCYIADPEGNLIEISSFEE